jgi:hypothetical protein
MGRTGGNMKTQFAGIAVAALLSIAWSLPGHAEDAAPPKDTATPAEAPANVPRPSIVPKAAEPVGAPRTSITPKTAEPAASPATADPAPRRHRRYAHRHYRRYAYWEPFPIYWPRIHRHHFSWSRIPWFAF